MAWEYNGYRGRGPLWKKAVAAGLVLVILLSGMVLALQKFLVYDEDGNPGIRFPDRNGGTSSALPPVSSEDLQITIQRPDKDAAALWLADTPLRDRAAAAERLAEAGTGGVCLTVKDADGYVYIDSAVTAALSRTTVVSDAVSQNAVEELLAEADGPHTVAYISCFRDSRVPILNVRGLGLRQRSGYLFYDGEDASWLDPAKAGAVEYLTLLARECAALGFDEILLSGVAYPTTGDLAEINYGGMAKSANLAAFLQSMRTALDGFGVKLSLELPESVVLTGSDETAGQVLAVLAPLVDCVYAETTAEKIPQLEAAVKAVSPAADFCPIVTDKTGVAGTYLLKE